MQKSWDFEHPLSTGNVLLCYRERYLFLRWIKIVKRASDSNYDPSMVPNMSFLPIKISNFMPNFSFRVPYPLSQHGPQRVVPANNKSQISCQISVFGYPTLSAKGMWCCASTRRDIPCCLATSYHSLNVLGWLEELPVANIWVSYGTQYVISANNKHQIWCK